MAAPTRPHILVGDDALCVREALAAALRAEYDVHAAATGAEALALLRAHPIVAIILDAVLGEEDGLDLIERFRSLTSPPIFILTGHGTEALATRALRAKVVDYLKKPVSVPALHATLERLLPPRGGPADLAARARRSLDEQAAKGVRVAAVAGQLGLSEAHLRRLFRQAYGKTPQQYLREARLRRAADLLRSTRLGVEQIGMGDVGSETTYARGGGPAVSSVMRDVFD